MVPFLNAEVNHLKHPHLSDSRRLRAELWRAIGVLFGATVTLAIAAALVPSLSGVLQACLAVLLFVVPSWALKGSGTLIDDLGVHLGPWRRTTIATLCAVGVVFPPFVMGYHLVHTQHYDRALDLDPDRLARWDEAVEDPPSSPCQRDDDQVIAWIGDDGLWVVSPADARLKVSAQTEPTALHAPAYGVRCTPDGPRATGEVTSREEAGLRSYTPAPGQGLLVPLTAETALRATVQLEDAPVPANRLKLGSWRQPAEEDGRIEATRSLGWILLFVIVQLGLVALPEEWFFRGYLQPRIDQLLGTPVRFLGAEVGWGLVLSSLAFALLHPILIPGVHRLLVFFPGLLFGWLRARTGSIGAAVFFHASCNLVLAIVSRFYS